MISQATPCVIFRAMEPTTYEFRCEDFDDLVIRVENVTSEMEACVKVRRMLKKLTTTDGLDVDVRRVVP